MKFLPVFTFFFSYLLVSCAGLKCYQDSNIDSYSSNVFIEDCDTDFIDFCGTSTFKNGESPDYTCGDDEFCTSKGCYDSMHCSNTGTYDYDYPELSDVKLTITCCDTDLCNMESSAQTLYRNSFSCLFYMSFFYFLYFITL